MRDLMARQAIKADVLHDLQCDDAPASLRRKIEHLDNQMLRHCIDPLTGRPIEERDELRKALLRKKMRVVGRGTKVDNSNTEYCSY